MGVSWSSRGHGYDQKLLALEGSNNGGFVIVINLGDYDTLRQFITTVFARQGCDCVFSGFKKGVGNVRANCASSLSAFVSVAV